MKYSDDLELYVKQDGMYNTLDIVISNIPIKDIKDWYKFNHDFRSFKEFLFHIKLSLMDGSDDIDFVRLIDYKIPDEIIITKKEIEMLNAHKMI